MRNREANAPAVAGKLTFLDLVLEGQPQGTSPKWTETDLAGAPGALSAERGAGVACCRAAAASLTTALCGGFAAALSPHALCKLLGGMSPLDASLAALSSRNVGRSHESNLMWWPPQLSGSTIDSVSAKSVLMRCSRHICFTDNRAYRKAGTQWTLVRMHEEQPLTG